MAVYPAPGEELLRTLRGFAAGEKVSALAHVGVGYVPLLHFPDPGWRELLGERGDARHLVAFLQPDPDRTLDELELVIRAAILDPPGGGRDGLFVSLDVRRSASTRGPGLWPLTILDRGGRSYSDNDGHGRNRDALVRCIVAAGLHDLAGITASKLGARLGLTAPRAVGTSSALHTSSSRAAKEYYRRGRLFLHAIKGWPWALFDKGVPPPKWWDDDEVWTALAEWKSQPRWSSSGLLMSPGILESIAETPTSLRR